jgi:hypothetical protein
MGALALFPSRRSACLVVFGCLLLLLIPLPLLFGCTAEISCGGQSTTTVLSTGSPTSLVVATTTPPTSSTTTSSTEPPFVQGEGEIFLDAAGQAGPESFTGETFLPAGPPSTLNIPTSTTLPLATSTTLPGSTGTTSGGLQLTSYTGGTPALYGGSKSKKQADKAGQLDFFEQNPQKAAAFCAALNSDPTFKWSGGNQIQPSQLRQYFDELTPVMLVRDTRVTNYGYRNGKPTPRQSVLQKGQMVLVDRYGVPRVRCECGNPLTPPKAVKTTPRYTGPRWPDFDPTVIIVIQPTVVVIEDFVLIDIYTGNPFERPFGTDGAQDTVNQATSWALTVQMTVFGNPVTWTADVVLNPDGTISGAGQGTYDMPNGVTTEGQGSSRVNTGTFSADAAFTVSISGTAETTPTGRVLKMQPQLGNVTLSNVVYDTTGDEAELRAKLPGDMARWIGGTFAELDLQAVDYGPLLATVTGGDGSQGSATLTPVLVN